MKSLYNCISIILLAIIFCAAKDEKPFDEYQGGRYGYSKATLKLYSDSTYGYSEWIHTGSSIHDNGKWGKINHVYYLSSKSKTRWTGRHGKSDKAFRFEMQQFTITADTLKLIPKNEKDADFFDAYYTFYKVKQEKK